MYIVDMGTDTSRTQCLRPMGTAKPSPYRLRSELSSPSSHIVQTLAVCTRTRNCSFFLPNIYNDLHICNLRLFPYTDFLPSLAISSSCAVCNKFAKVSRWLPNRSHSIRKCTGTDHLTPALLYVCLCIFIPFIRLLPY